jgi:hypothetical protein
LGAGDLDGLAVARRVIYTGGAVFLDGGHVVSSYVAIRPDPEAQMAAKGRIHGLGRVARAGLSHFP